MLKLCERFGCLPSELYEEDVDLLRMIAIEELGGGRDEGEEGMSDVG